jgi:predicted Zn-dependent protease
VSSHLSFLQTQGLIARDEPVTYWDGERLREVKITGTEIYREPEPSDLPPDLESLLGEAVALFNEHKPAEAEARLQDILARVPDHPVAVGNLAAVRSMQGRHEESHRLLREVVAKHPDYLFARCNLARILIEEDQLDEAEQLLKGLGERERLHIQEAFAVYGATAMLSTARGEHEASRSLLARLERMVEDEDDERRMAQVKRAVARLDPVERFKQVLGAAVKSPPRPSKGGW